MSRTTIALTASLLLLGACAGRSELVVPVAPTARAASTASRPVAGSTVARSTVAVTQPTARPPVGMPSRRAPVNLPVKYDTARASAPGFPAVDTPFDQMKAQARSTGKPAILYFCANWCGCCTRLNRDTLSDPAVQRRIAEFPATLYDSGSRVGRAVANQYGIDAYPTMVLIDGSGREVDLIVGARPPAEFLAQLARY